MALEKEWASPHSRPFMQVKKKSLPSRVESDYNASELVVPGSLVTTAKNNVSDQL